MKALVASDALTPLLYRVSAWERPRQLSAPPGAIFAVFPDADGNGFLGLVTSQDIARFPDRIFADLLSGAAPAIDSTNGLDEIERRFSDADIGALPVMNGGHFIGAVTRESMLKALLERERVLLERTQSLSRDLERDRSGLARWSDQLRALHGINYGLLEMISGLDDMNALMQAGIERLTALIATRYGALGIVDEAGRLTHFFHVGLDDETARRIGNPPVGVGLLGEVLSSEQVLRVDDLRADPRHGGFPPHHPPMQSLLAVPISYRGRTLGRVYLCDKAGGATFSDRDELLTLNFANMLASLLIGVEEQERRRQAEREASRLLAENRQLNRHLVTALEEERRHIARELHDEMGQCTTAIQAEAEIIRRSRGDTEPGIIQGANRISELAAHLFDVVHAMLRRLRPELLDDLGLSEALRYTAQTWQTRFPNIRCRLHLGDSFHDLDEAVGITAYRIVQECLTNVARHAEASSVTIRVSRRHRGSTESDSLYLAIRDNGRGLAGMREGLGLAGLRERVQSLGGRLSVSSGKDGGTLVEAYLPISTLHGEPEGKLTPASSIS